MKNRIIALLMMVIPAVAFASGDVQLEKADIDLHNQESLQKGAKLFVNYCLSCHSAKYMRYSRMGEDIGLSKEYVKDNLMLAAEKIGETMTVAMRPKDAQAMFGTKILDLTVVARARGADWLYTYLTTFYIDESRPWGVNNAAFKDVGMPHVLWELEGLKKPIFKTETGHDGREVTHISGYEMVKPGKLSQTEYKAAANDLVNFLVYMGEPAKLKRYTIGIWVLVFLVLLFVVSYALKKEYWKDIH